MKSRVLFSTAHHILGGKNKLKTKTNPSFVQSRNKHKYRAREMKGRRQTKPFPERPVPAKFLPSRDSDASICSSRPSSVGTGRPSSISNLPSTTDRSYQSAALRSINSYLSSISSPIHLRPPLPSAKDILDAFRLLLSRLRWDPSPSGKVEDDLPLLLSHLRCPFPLKKSALKAPSTPHAFPSVVAVLHWMVQIARYHDHLSSNPSPFFSPSNHHLLHAVHSYSFFIRGDDDSLASLDSEYDQRLQHQVDDTESAVNSLRQEALDLESRLLAARSTPSSRELLEKEKAELVEDARKFNAVVENFDSKVAAKEKALEEREKELSAKVEENRRICEENEELKRQIDSQAVNVRDVERMKRELQAVERDIADAETERNAWEEKMWDLEATAGQNIKELEGLITESNQTIRRLKLGNDFQYVLNAEGSTPAEVLGVDYKATLKPTLTALADEAKKSSMAKLEELISLQQQSRENAAKHEAKKTHLAALQSRLEEIEAQLTMLKKEMQDQATSCMAEAERLRKDAERREHNLDLTEKEAEEYLKRCEHNLQNVIRQNDEETQMCIGELLALIDAVSKYKEYIESTISQMKGELSETAGAITDAYKASLSAKIGTYASNPST